MARARKARVEGAKAAQNAANDKALADPANQQDGTGDVKRPDPVPGDDGEALDRIVESFRVRFPEQWEEWRLCPLESGLIAMALKLND